MTVTLSDVGLAAVRRTASAWREEAERRRRISQHDQVAEALDFCAAEIVEQLREIEAPDAMRTVEQYAHDHGISPQTCRNWIHRGELEAFEGPHGFRIRRTARRVKQRRRQEAA